MNNIVKDMKPIWLFNAGNTFSGNPKYLFLYINKYRDDIDPIWVCDGLDTVTLVKSFGFKACAFGTSEAEIIKRLTTVFVVEQVKEHIPLGLENVIILNLFHGVGIKPIERGLEESYLLERVAKKYIKYSDLFKNNQLFLVTSPFMEEHFKKYIMLTDEQIIRGPYPRCAYALRYGKFTSYNHDIRLAKGLGKSTKIAIYAPTYRDTDPGRFILEAIPDFERLHDVLERNNCLLIFKFHPHVENDLLNMRLKETYQNKKYFLFWDNKNDIYEILHDIDTAIIDYSSILYDMLYMGIKNIIRYIFDYDQGTMREFVYDYMEYTCGSMCNNFEELLLVLQNINSDIKEIEGIKKTFWSYSDNSFDSIINTALNFSPKNAIGKNLYSFDVFDTIIQRKCFEPKGIFYYVKETMCNCKNQFQKFFIKNYVHIRQQSEQCVRDYYAKTMQERKSDRREVLFHEIFSHMQRVYNLDSIQVDFLMSAELQAEKENSIPVQENIQIVKSLQASGEEIVFISDMYLNEDVVKQLLEIADPAFKNIPLFLSSEYGVQKSTKKLFLEVYKTFKPYAFSQWIHYGDNPTADGKMPRALGIKTINHEPHKFNAYEQRLVEDLDSYDGYLVAGNMARFRKHCSNDVEYFAYAYVSLYLVPYIKWVIDDAIRKNIKALYFISRDGHYLKLVADTIIAQKKLSINTKYIFGSRRVWRVPSFIDSIDDEFFYNFGNFSEIDTFYNLLDAINLSTDEFEALFPTFSYFKNKQVLANNELSALKLCMKCSEKYKNILLYKSKCDRNIVLKYLQQEIDLSESHAFVEYWGRGYTQECFSRLISCILQDNYISKFYYARSIYQNKDNLLFYNFTTNTSPLIFVEAIFANMPYKTIQKYLKTDNWKIFPELETNETCNTNFHIAVESVLLKFTEDFCSEEYVDEIGLGWKLFDFSCNFFQHFQDDKYLTKFIAPLRDNIGVYGRTMEFAPALDEEFIKSVHNGIPVSKLTRSIKMSLARSNSDMVKKYNEALLMAKSKSKIIKKKQEDIHKENAKRLHSSGDIEGSALEATKALKINPCLGWAYIQLSRYHDSKGELDKAITTRKKAIELEPACLWYREYYLKLLTRGGYIKDALDAAQEALALDSTLEWAKKILQEMNNVS